MRSPTSSSCNYGTATSFGNRLNTVFKKASELSILCETEVYVIYYGPDGKLQTWPPETEKVKDMALRYKATTKRKKSHNLDEFLHKMKNYKGREKKKRSKKNLKNPIFDELITSLELTLPKLKYRLEALKQRTLYNGCGQNLLCMDKISNTNFQYPQPYSAFLSELQDPALMQQQQELYGCDHQNVPLLSYTTLPHEFQNADAVCTSFLSQDMLLSSYDATISSQDFSTNITQW